MPTAIALARRDKEEGTVATCACVRSRLDLTCFWLCPRGRIPNEANADQRQRLVQDENYLLSSQRLASETMELLCRMCAIRVYASHEAAHVQIRVLYGLCTARLCLTLMKKHTTAAVCALQANLRVQFLGPSIRQALLILCTFPTFPVALESSRSSRNHTTAADIPAGS